MSRSGVERKAADWVAELLLKGTYLTSLFSYPLSWESLQIDDNQSLYVDYTPDYRPSQPLKQNITADLTIIGGGFTGISAAYHFSEQYPEKRVVVLEAKQLANGASGRNGGMMLNWITGVTDDSDEMTKRIYDATNAGIDMIVEIIKKHDLKVSYRRDGSMTVFTDPERAQAAKKHVDHLNSIGIPMQFVEGDEIPIQLQGVYGAAIDPNEGQLVGVQFIRELKPVLMERGVEFYEYTPVLNVREGRHIILETPHADVISKAIVLATNAYTGKLGYFRKAIFPLHSHVFATAPLSKTQQDIIQWGEVSSYADDLDRISYVSMTNEGNLVFGGGSNESYDYLYNNKTAYPGTPAMAAHAFRAMEETFYTYSPKAKGIPITHRWTGTLAVSLNRLPAVGVTGKHKNIYYGLGYSGHGLTLANLAGKIITDIYSGDDEEWRKLPIYNADFAPLPLEPFRWIGYQLMTRLTGKSPRV